MGCASRLAATVGVTLSVISCVLSLLSFLMPYWIYVDKTISQTRMTTTDAIQFQYHYGFWKYCSRMTSSTMTSNICGDVVTHQVWEQLIVCLVLLALILQLNGIFNGVLYLVIFKDETLCSYIAGSSVAVAGVFLLTGVILYRAQNRNILQFTESHVVPFETSQLNASFWCAFSSSALSIIASILFLTASLKSNSDLDDGTAIDRVSPNFRRRRRIFYPVYVRRAKYNAIKKENENALSLNSKPKVFSSSYGAETEKMPYAEQIEVHKKRIKDENLNPLKSKPYFSGGENSKAINFSSFDYNSTESSLTLYTGVMPSDNKETVLCDVEDKILSPSSSLGSPAVENQVPPNSIDIIVYQGSELKDNFDNNKCSLNRNVCRAFKNPTKQQKVGGKESNTTERSSDVYTMNSKDTHLSKNNASTRKITDKQYPNQMSMHAWTTPGPAEKYVDPQNLNFL